jgi:CHC2 zinc finger
MQSIDTRRGGMSTRQRMKWAAGARRDGRGGIMSVIPNGHDFAAIKAAHPIVPFLESRGTYLHRHGKYHVGKCPIHAEKNGRSFAVWPDEGKWKCFGKCGCGGDITDLLAKLEQVTVAEAADRLEASIPGGIIPVIHAPVIVVKENVEVVPYELTNADISRMATAAYRLACDPSLIARLCEKRPEWSPEAIRAIALEGDFGYEEGGIVLFGYCHGIKERRKDGEGERRFRWACGAAHGKCWRQGLLSRSHHTVYMTEGETDGITLVSMGVEIPGETLVLALAAAQVYPDASPFADKRIIVVPDLDKAGTRSAEELQRRFCGIAKSIEFADLREVTSA